jgi:hypothetical protein
LVNVWLEGSTAPTRNISGNLSVPYSVFVTDNYDVYVDNGEANYMVNKWSLNSTNGVAAMYVCKGCYGLFIDINNNLYCSMYNGHQILSKSLNSRLNVWSLVAGTGSAGSASNMLNSPCGIFTDTNLDFYVADSSNNRIQKFPFGQLNGTTVAGATVVGTITLNKPIAVVLDADGYLFISDDYGHRIVGSGPYGFQCIAACSGAGSSSTALDYPVGLGFDTYGNIYVVDWGNSRIQKFLLANNSCGKI